MSKKIILCRGIQGSGKSTWAKQWAMEDPEHRVRFNYDDLRNMMGKYWVPDREDALKDLKRSFLRAFMGRQFDIVIDNMNLNPKEVNEYYKIIDEYNTAEYTNPDTRYELEFKDFFIPLDECIKRDACRPNPIGEEVIRNTWRKYRDFIVKIECDKIIELRKKITYNNELDNCVLCDLDATIAFRNGFRPFWGPGAAEGIKNDLPDLNMRELLNLYANAGVKLIFVTGREDADGIAEATKEWLDNLFPEFILITREKGDHRPGPDVKKDLYYTYIKPHYNVLAVFDDSKKVVDMYREEGLFVLQPNDGKF